MKIYSDGFASHKRSGYLICDEQAKILLHKEYEPGTYTNNEAEYNGVLQAAMLAENYDTILTDSLLVVNQTYDRWKNIDNKFIKVRNEIRSLLRDKKISLKWIERDLNYAGVLVDQKYRR